MIYTDWTDLNLQDMKMRMCLIAGIIILILVIVLPAGEFGNLIPLVPSYMFPVAPDWIV